MNPVSESTFFTEDGLELFYRSWLPSERAADKAVIILHRGHEHSGRVEHLVRELGLDDCAVFAWDQRGHGRSPGERGYAPEFYDLVRDLDSFVRHLSQRFGLAEDRFVVVAHSVASVIACLWILNFAPQIRGLVLATPAFRVKLYVPFALPLLRAYLAIWRWLGKGTPFIQSYVKGRMLTHDSEQAKSYESDPLVCKRIAVNILIGLFDGASRILTDAGAIRVPLQLHCARADWVVKNRPIREFFQSVSSQRKEVHVYRGFYHAVFHESERALPIERTRRFIEEAFEASLPSTDLLDADKCGYTRDEYEWLAAGVPALSFKRVFYSSQRLMMNTLGRLSEGIRLGYATGFDSGPTLDYVYRNEARGESFIGRAIDRSYLNAIGWRGIRQRRINLEAAISEAIKQRFSARGSESQPIRIVDLAGGGGRYLVAAAKSHPEVEFDLLIRDYSEASLERSRAVVKEICGLDNDPKLNVRIAKGDAFSADSLAQIEAGIDIAVVSGLYELFPANEGVKRSLQGLAAVIRPGGFLIYTGQPWHPQLEMIAETLKNREGESWIMRRRTQAELDQLVSAAGFAKTRTRVDSFGIFTVSSAVRR